MQIIGQIFVFLYFIELNKNKRLGIMDYLYSYEFWLINKK